jgi:hypothetical protein
MRLAGVDPGEALQGGRKRLWNRRLIEDEGAAFPDE